MGRRKRHHTVTRALLEGFAQGTTVIQRVRRGDEFGQSINNATVVADFYSFDSQGAPDDAMEGWLAEVVEADFTALLPDLRSGLQPTNEMRPAIVRFVAAAATRSRTARSYMEQIDRHCAGTVVLMRLAPKMGWQLAEMSIAEVCYLRSWCQQAWDALPPAPEREASFLRVVVRESREIETALSSYVWSVAISDVPSFLIGDAPVLSIGGQSVGWHGLIPRGSVVFLPLSPHAVLVGEPHVLSRPVAPANLVRAVNGLTTREAYDAVFRHPAMIWPDGLTLGRQPYQLPEPSFTLTRSDPGVPNTFPYRYPEMDDEQTAALLRHLNAVDVVE